MDKKLKIATYCVILFLITALTEANTKILFTINQVNLSSWFDVFFAMLKALGYSLASMIIIIYYKRYWVKSIFIAMDGFIVFTYLHFKVGEWGPVASYIYAFYTALIFAFVGQMAHEYMQKEAQAKEDESEVQRLKGELKAFRIREELARVKQTGRGSSWRDDPELVEKVTALESELVNLGQAA